MYGATVQPGQDRAKSCGSLTYNGCAVFALLGVRV